ncbi:MAG: FHA domain-containing protein [Gemmatimonadota bacterium]|nr:FHA domain-containing protein [Gemmatimonadota bacterium]MDH3422581.1 FHA domain-containing protein [Gemmatimonadota bacterium]
MPKLTLLLGRRTMQVYDFKQPSIVIGRDEGVDVLIDNPSVSRRHAEIRLGDNGWEVEDLGSSNGTFIGGTKIQGAHSLGLGDEIGFGKFSIVFGKVLGDGEQPKPVAAPETQARQAPMGGAQGTMHINPHEVRELLKDSDRKKRAHVLWESGGQRGTHYLSDAPAVLIGTDDLCDLQVPKAPKHHVLVIKTEGGWDVRFLATFGSMTVRGRSKKRAKLKDGDVVEAGGLKLTFMDDVA